MYNYFSFALIPLINRFSESYETTSEAEMLDFANISIIYDFFSLFLSHGPLIQMGSNRPQAERSIWQCRYFIIFLTRITNAKLVFLRGVTETGIKYKHKGGNV